MAGTAGIGTRDFDPLLWLWDCGKRGIARLKRYSAAAGEPAARCDQERQDVGE